MLNQKENRNHVMSGNVMRAAVCVAGIALLFCVTACKALFSDIEEDFSYWASEPIITDFKVESAVSPGVSGVQYVPSAGNAVITLTVRNPKKFSFVMPDSSGAPADIVTFESGIQDASGTNPPVPGTDYTLGQSAHNTLTLTYSKAFLKRYEQSRANIGASIRLYSTDGRKFNQIYKFNLEANTPPPNPAPVFASDDNHIALFKTRTPDSQGKRYYVLCFKVAGFTESGATDLHSDLTHVYVSKNGGAETPCPVTLTTADFDITHSGGTFIAETDVDKLSNAEAEASPGSGSPLPDNVPSDSWVLYFKTDVPVGGGTAKYRIRLFDGKLYSDYAQKSTSTRELSVPKVFAHADIDNVAAFGVYTEATKIVTPSTIATVDGNDLNGGGVPIGGVSPDGSDATHAIPVYSAYGEAVKLTIKKPDGTDYPAGVTVTGSAEKHSGDSASGDASFTAGQSAVVMLPPPTNAGGQTYYKVVFKATGEGFDDSATRTLYYKVRREIKAVNNLPMWYMLGAAIEKIPLGGAGTVKISGTIKAENIIYPQLPDGSSVENDSTIDVSGRKDSGEYPGRTVTVIGDSKTSSILDASNLCSVFSIEFNGKLILKNVTLKKGEDSSGGYGGGISISDNGSSCEMTDTDITNCISSGGMKLGGAVYVRIDGSLTVGSGCVISGNTAPGGKGAGIYVESGGTFNIAGNAQIDEGNDVFLEKNADVPYVPSKNAKITVTAPLTGTHTIAKITPEDYTVGVTAVNAASGVDIGGYSERFKITDQTIISPPSTVLWKLRYNSNNTLVLKANVPITVNGANPNAWKTLKEAIEAESVEDGDEFLVQGTITATSATDNNGAIRVTKKITVKGTGSTPVLDANSNGTDRPPTPHRIFTVENGAELKLEDITLTGGMATGAENGGAILIKEGGAANIKNTQIYECKATNGGAIYNKGSLSLSLCHIGDNGKPNEATDDGGAIFSQTTATAHFTILGTEIKHNTAGRSGGGICIISGKCTISSEGSTPTLIDNNTCSGSTTIGGGLHIGAGGDCTISGDTKISNNSCANGSGGGGGVCVSGTFVMEGGARVVPPSVAVAGKNDVLLMPGKYITLKSALSGTDPVALITPSRYESDRKILKGEDYTLTAPDANRFAVTPKVENGVTYKWELIPDSENFCKLKMGDAIIPSTGSNRWKKLKTEAEKTNGPDVIIIDGEILATSGPGNSGEIEIGRNLTIKGKNGATTDKLDADNRSRIFKVENGKTLTLEKLTLKNGNDHKGGGIYAGTGTKVNLNVKIIIQECKATEGGAIYNDGGTLTIKGGSVIKGNEVTNNGGAFLIKSGSLHMENNCIVEQNKAKKGGGIYITDSGSATIRYCRASQNEAQDDGGGIYVAGGASCTLDGVTMKDNTVNNGKGSAVYVAKEYDNTTTLTLKGDVQIGDSPNSNTICLSYASSGSTIQTAFVSATSADLSGSPYINIEPEDYIKQSNKDLIKGERIDLNAGNFHLTNIPTSEGSWSLNSNLQYNGLALKRTSANLTASGTGDWKALKETIASLPSNGGTLILNGIFEATSGDDNIIINRVLTIDGNDSAVINANGKCRIFKMISGSLILKDITLKNGNATGSGEEAYGGGVYVKNGQFTMQGSTRIEPSTGSDANTPGKNDVYLKDGKTINIVGVLTGSTPVARITPEDYRSGTQVLYGDIKLGTPQKNYKKFVVTPDGVPPWFVGSDGKLTYTPPSP